jgi:hypothetical protein
MKDRSIDFNTLLTLANLLVLGLTLYTFSAKGENEYVNQQSIVLAVLLAIETQVALVLERWRRDPFVLLLVFSMVLYYSLRIITLLLYPYSVVFDRYAYDASDTNYALVFMLFANACMYAGFFTIGFRPGGQRVNTEGWKATSPLGVVVVMLTAIAFAYLTGNYWNEGNVPRGLNFLVLFLSPNIIILMALSYFFLFRKSLGRQFAVIIASLIVIEMIAHTLIGSRGAIVLIVQNCILVLLAVAGHIRFSRGFLALGVLLMPVLIALLLASFAISTYNRTFRTGGANLDMGRAMQLAIDGSSQLASAAPSMDVLIPPIAARAGFFDFSAEIIAHREQYASVLNFPAYGRSIVDNILSPGFDLYDQPKLSNALQFIYRDWGRPSKQEVPDSYQSDQFGVYGEFYALFGYASLPILFLVALALKGIYVSFKAGNPFVLTMKRVIVLFVFTRIVDSFGFDWAISDTLPLIVAMFVYSFFFTTRRIRDGAPGSEPCAASSA